MINFEEGTGAPDEPKPATSYQVGYGKPPPLHRFQPGKSGNPKGRPARIPTTGDVFRKVLKKPVVVSEGGRKRKISTEEALFLRVRRDALEGDAKARRDFFALIEKHAPHQLGVGTGNGDRDATRCAANGGDADANAITVLVALAGDLLRRRQDRFETLSEVDHDDAGTRALLVMLDQPEHDLTLVTGELAVGDVGRGVPQPLNDHLACCGGGDASEVHRGVVPLTHQLTIRVDLAGENHDLAVGAIDLHPGVRCGTFAVAVGGDQRGLNGLEESVEGNVLLTLDTSKGR